MDQVEAFRKQAAACRDLGSPMYGELLERLTADLEAGGVTADVLAGHEDDPGPSALALRLLGSVHRLVLDPGSGTQASALAAYYPSVGGRWDVDAAWPVFRELLAEQPEAVREWLDRPPQTNEVGRAGALVGGLLQLPWRLPVRLFEMGSSGGLNLLADRFAYVDQTGAAHGDPDSPVRLDDAWRGRRLEWWPEFRIAERVGSDVAPVDPTTDEGRLVLTAYVWPDQTERHQRLRGALELARQEPPPVRRTAAVDFVAGLALQDQTATVLWHSVMWQYLSAAEQDTVTARIDELGSAATDTAPFARLSLEPTRRTPEGEHEFLVVLTAWPGGERRILGTSRGHGIPTTWE
jgi:hypothetical protein